ncbi:2Fe-2S iron-sulfur cluster-binding protein [Hansschlegelia beijingensis]
MSQSNRLAAGGLIDRASSIGFTFDGRRYAGHPGDTLASALLANGVKLVGRSFKYHRPRGVLTAGSEEPNALVELRSGARREPNAKATVAELYDGLEATSQNRWPSLAFDVMAVNQLASPVFVAGFYYKTFMWPAKFWEKLYEPMIRRAAGLGRLSGEADPDSYEKITAHCDVLVIGSGPAGLAAALAAGRSGARVILAEEDFALGGRLNSDRRLIGDKPSAAWAAEAVAELESLPEVTVLRRTPVVGVYDDGVYAALERVSDHMREPGPHRPRERLWRIVAKRAVLAAGALERPIPFGGNDTPGVMLASARKEGRETIVPHRPGAEMGGELDRRVPPARDRDQVAGDLEAAARAPFTPVAIGALAGAHRHKEFRPTRLPPSHFWAEEQGAVFTETGQWMRAAYFPRVGEKDWFESAVREVETVRTAVGVYDASTLGKIDIQGADAGVFLDRVYVNAFSSLAVGKARYGLMLREDGVAMDDGTTTRLGETHYYMTTTTANAGGVMRHLELCKQWLWPELDVHFSSVTDQWAQYAIAGPRSREVVAALVDEGFDVSNEALPYMGAKELTVCGGVKARLFRLSFSGELAYELAVPARYGDAMIRAIMKAGEPFGICPYGAEALAIMRIEKGHAAGPELNGNTTAADLGMGKMLSKKKDFIGRTMSGREAFLDPERPSLVGFRPVDRSARLRSGAHFVPRGETPSAANDQGYMTSTAYSPSNGHWIGLGFLARGPERMGEIVRAYDPVRGGDVEVEVVSPVFVDPEGARLRG